jgi:hypothetical protein
MMQLRKVRCLVLLRYWTCLFLPMRGHDFEIDCAAAWVVDSYYKGVFDCCSQNHHHRNFFDGGVLLHDTERPRGKSEP